ncbi:hypothetical protein AB0942_35800 [Streptomyces nodosus]
MQDEAKCSERERDPGGSDPTLMVALCNAPIGPSKGWAAALG